jgi:hypothetical protein
MHQIQNPKAAFWFVLRILLEVAGGIGNGGSGLVSGGMMLGTVLNGLSWYHK